MSAQDPYSCLYWRVKADERFDHVFGCDPCWAAYTRLLMDAEASYPAPASIPSHLRPHAKAHLLDAGIIELRPHDCFIVHGLQKEREKRSEAGRESAIKGWEKRRNGPPMAPHRPAKATPMLATQRNASQHNAQDAPDIDVEPIPICPVHDAPMRPSKGGGWYCSKKVNGEYCKHSAVGVPEEDPYDRAQRVRDAADKARNDREQERRRQIDADKED